MPRNKMFSVKYVVLVDCRDDLTGKTYQPGDLISPEDFPQRVIANWLEIGVLQIATTAMEVEDGSREE